MVLFSSDRFSVMLYSNVQLGAEITVLGTAVISVAVLPNPLEGLETSLEVTP